MAKSPTVRSLEYLREQGYLVEVVEKTVPYSFIKMDLFGFGDLLAIRENEVLLVQVTSGSNVSARVKKIAEHENIGMVRKANIRVIVMGWRKLKEGWAVKVVDMS